MVGGNGVHTGFGFNFISGATDGSEGEEQERLLVDEEQAEEDNNFPPQWATEQPSNSNPHAHLPVYTTIFT